MDEIELKFLDINVDQIKKKLLGIGAELVFSAETASYPFLAPGFDSKNSQKKYLRIRRINDDVTITYKDPAIESSMTSRQEVEIHSDNFEQSVALLEKLGFKKGMVFRKHREHYELGDTHFELDTVNNIPTYLEIETQNEKDMYTACEQLGLDVSTGKKGTIVEILPEKFKE